MSNSFRYSVNLKHYIQQIWNTSLSSRYWMSEKMILNLSIAMLMVYTESCEIITQTKHIKFLILLGWGASHLFIIILSFKNPQVWKQNPKGPPRSRSCGPSSYMSAPFIRIQGRNRTSLGGCHSKCPVEWPSRAPCWLFTSRRGGWNLFRVFLACFFFIFGGFWNSVVSRNCVLYYR